MTKTAEKTNKTSLSHKIFTALGAILCVILTPILIINITLIIRSYTNPNEVPSIGGTFPLIVLSDSMYPVFESGDLIICNTAEPEEVKAGDIIAYFDPQSNSSAIVSHRVIEVASDENGVAYRTKGDANNTEDGVLVPYSKLVGVYKSRIPGLGNVALFMQTTKGLVVCVVCPIILLVAYDYFRRRQYEKKKELETKALLEELEQLRKEKGE